VNLKNLSNGFVHGFLIDNTIFQYVLLILIKLGLIYIVLKKKKLLKPWVRFSACVYFVCGILIDVMCLLSTEQKLPNTEFYFIFKSFKLVDVIGYFLIGLTASTVGLQIIMDII
jgi:hypothetical protein